MQARTDRQADTYEITRDGLSHVQELEKAVLGVRPGLAKINLSDVVVHRVATQGHTLPVGLHVNLLCMSRKFAESFGVRKHRSCFIAEK